jgi:hypothetical protein
MEKTSPLPKISSPLLENGQQISHPTCFLFGKNTETLITLDNSKVVEADNVEMADELSTTNDSKTVLEYELQAY